MSGNQYMAHKDINWRSDDTEYPFSYKSPTKLSTRSKQNEWTVFSTHFFFILWSYVICVDNLCCGSLCVFHSQLFSDQNSLKTWTRSSKNSFNTPSCHFSCWCLMDNAVLLCAIFELLHYLHRCWHASFHRLTLHCSLHIADRPVKCANQ